MGAMLIMDRINSPQNERVKRVIRLRARSDRDTEGLFLIEGNREIRRALAAGIQPDTVFFCPSLMAKPDTDLPDLCASRGYAPIECSENVFRRMAYGDHPGGILIVAPQIRKTLATLALPDNPLVLVAVEIEKPGNLGALIRSADAAGVAAVIACDGATDVFNPNAIRASIGLVFSMPVVETTTSELLPWLRHSGLKILASTPHADLDYTRADLRNNLAIAVGAEDRGLSNAWLQAADLKVRIPMRGKADSLNVSVAASALLFEAARQRHAGDEQ